MAKDTPIHFETVRKLIKDHHLPDIGRAKIREIVKLVNEIEKATGEKYIRMEMGVPGLKPADVGTEAEIDALKRGVASVYANIANYSSILMSLRPAASQPLVLCREAWQPSWW